MALLVLTARADDKKVLNMLSQTEVLGSHIRLEELVADKTALPAAWGDRVVLKAPEAGKSATVSLLTIAYALQKYPDMGQVTLRGTENTVISRAAVPLPMDRIREAAEAYVRAHEHWSGDSVDVVCETPARAIKVPVGKLSLQVSSFEEETNRPDRYRFQFNVRVDDTIVQTFQVPVRVFPIREVWVATRALSRGHVLTAEDVQPSFMPLQDSASSAVGVGDPVIGLELSRGIKAGQTLARPMLLTPLCAQKGDMILVQAAKGNLSISLQAKALAYGRRGDRIQCMNERTKRRIMVQLTNIKEGSVDFAGPSEGTQQ
ncbi:MAG: flagellar basal body P-ring formation protein FlgA [Lentisphaerae bacterium]|nr:flagellar basal body P-ring formation protein FlgA [Lentisphaerota bacterium]